MENRLTIQYFFVHAKLRSACFDINSDNAVEYFEGYTLTAQEGPVINAAEIISPLAIQQFLPEKNHIITQA